MFSRYRRVFTTAASNKEPLVRIMERIYDNLFVISTATTLNTVLLFWITVRDVSVKNNVPTTVPPLGPL
jgi:hypothetical protein